MARKPILGEQRNRSGNKKRAIGDNNTYFKKTTLGVFGNHAFACELSAFIAKRTDLSVILVDADAMYPLIAETIGLRRTFNTRVVSNQDTTSSFNLVMDYISKNAVNQEVLKSMCVQHHKCNNLYVLSGNDDLNNYEHYVGRSFDTLMIELLCLFDLVIINVNRFAYDEFVLKTMVACDYMIHPIDAYADSMKVVTMTLQYIREHQGLSLDKHKFVGYNYNPNMCLSKDEMNLITENNVIGYVSYNKKRNACRNNFKQSYAFNMTKDNLNEYRKIANYFNIKTKRRFERWQ